MQAQGDKHPPSEIRKAGDFQLEKQKMLSHNADT